MLDGGLYRPSFDILSILAKAACLLSFSVMAIFCLGFFTRLSWKKEPNEVFGVPLGTGLAERLAAGLVVTGTEALIGIEAGGGRPSEKEAGRLRRTAGCWVVRLGGPAVFRGGVSAMMASLVGFENRGTLCSDRSGLGTAFCGNGVVVKAVAVVPLSLLSVLIVSSKGFAVRGRGVLDMNVTSSSSCRAFVCR